jgi:hypothetical protein
VDDGALLVGKMGFVTKKSNFQNSADIKNYSEDESKMKIIPCTDFLHSIIVD